MELRHQEINHKTNDQYDTKTFKIYARNRQQVDDGKQWSIAGGICVE
jgi:hypothetical protein